MAEQWSMTGALIGACNCDWGCPCNFNQPPTDNLCDGVYVWAVERGRYGDVALDGIKFAFAAHSDGPLHEGNVTALLVIDEKATAEQRDALQVLARGNGVGLPFDIFASVTKDWLDTRFAPIEVSLNGIDSRVMIDGGDLYELEISRMKNPVTGDEEEIYIDKPTGFTSTRAELGMSTKARFSCNGLSFDTSGKYAEHSSFEYAGS
jgi:hypothetical protein